MTEPLELHVEQYGAGPSLVLAHGFGGSARNFRPQARAFAARASVWLYDARGHARSAAPNDPALYTESALIDDFGRVAVKAGGEIIAGGLSLGAYTALKWALESSTPPRALVLSAYPSPGTRAGRRDWALGFAQTIDEEGLEAAGARFVWGEVSRFDPKGAALIRQGFLEHSPGALAAILRSVLAELPAPRAFAESLRAFRAPVLVIVGGADDESLEPSRELAELLPHAELVVIPGAGHVVNLADPRAYNEALGAFLDRVLPRL
jgi:pimeloyl-ACP methyl ester carboxylesterase